MMKFMLTLQGKRLLVFQGILANERVWQAKLVSCGEAFYDVFIAQIKGRV
jgi:hypothetical protein